MVISALNQEKVQCLEGVCWTLFQQPRRIPEVGPTDVDSKGFFAL